jgi:hypothetical protein
MCCGAGAGAVTRLGAGSTFGCSTGLKNANICKMTQNDALYNPFNLNRTESNGKYFQKFCLPTFFGFMVGEEQIADF